MKYFVRLGFDSEQEVSRERYAEIEAAACPRDAHRRADPARSGFVGYVDPGEPATPARSAAAGRMVIGRVDTSPGPPAAATAAVDPKPAEPASAPPPPGVDRAEPADIRAIVLAARCAYVPASDGGGGRLARSAAERAIGPADVLRLVADEPAILAATVSPLDATLEQAARDAVVELLVSDLLYGLTPMLARVHDAGPAEAVGGAVEALLAPLDVDLPSGAARGPGRLGLADTLLASTFLPALATLIAAGDPRRDEEALDDAVDTVVDEYASEPSELVTALLDLPDACDRRIAGATSVAAVAAGTLRAWMRRALTGLVEDIRLDIREKMRGQRSDPHGS